MQRQKPRSDGDLLEVAGGKATAEKAARAHEKTQYSVLLQIATTYNKQSDLVGPPNEYVAVRSQQQVYFRSRDWFFVRVANPQIDGFVLSLQAIYCQDRARHKARRQQQERDSWYHHRVILLERREGPKDIETDPLHLTLKLSLQPSLRKDL